MKHTIQLSEQSPKSLRWHVMTGQHGVQQIVIRQKGTTLTLRPYREFKNKWRQATWFYWLKLMVWLKIW